MTKISPAQERILKQLDDKLVAYVGKSTDAAANTVHAPATEALARKGIVEIIPSEEQPGRRLARRVIDVVEEPPPTLPSIRQPPPPPAPPPGGKGSRSAGSRRRAKADKAAQSRPPATPLIVFDLEPEAIRKARARIKRLVTTATEGHPPQAVHLVLAIVNQETGNHAAANALIEEYRLDEMFGLKRFS